jgi:hypothetical protein
MNFVPRTPATGTPATGTPATGTVGLVPYSTPLSRALGMPFITSGTPANGGMFHYSTPLSRALGMPFITSGTPANGGLFRYSTPLSRALGMPFITSGTLDMDNVNPYSPYSTPLSRALGMPPITSGTLKQFEEQHVSDQQAKDTRDALIRATKRLEKQDAKLKKLEQLLHNTITEKAVNYTEITKKTSDDCASERQEAIKRSLSERLGFGGAGPYFDYNKPKTPSNKGCTTMAKEERKPDELPCHPKDIKQSNEKRKRNDRGDEFIKVPRYNNEPGSPHNEPGSPHNEPGSPHNGPGSTHNEPGHPANRFPRKKLCAYGTNCKKHECGYAHRVKDLDLCKWGSKCRNKECTFLLHTQKQKDILLEKNSS